jgi:hypothetical protein
LANLSLDDILWHQAMVVTGALTERNNREVVRPGVEWTFDDQILLRLLRLGVVDPNSEFDRPWDGSTRSMRFTSAVGERMWCLLEEQRARVS